MRKATFTAGELARILGGEAVGDPDVKVKSPARIEYAKAGDITFYANPKYEKYVYGTKASVLIVNRSFEPKEAVGATLIRVDDAYAAVPKMLEFFSSQRRPRGNRFSARFFRVDNTHISLSAKIGSGTYIYPQVYIGPDVRIGRNCILYPGVKIFRGCVVGDDCIFHANVVIGGDGFGFAKQNDGTYRKIPQTGNVIIGDNVDLGVGTTVDRAVMGSTIIHDGVKIDNQCMVAHNVEIGENTVMAALSGIAGSAKVGKNCVIGGQVGIAGHINIPDGTQIAGGSGVISTIKEPGTVVMGYPALEHRQFLKAYALFRNAPDKR